MAAEPPRKGAKLDLASEPALPPDAAGSPPLSTRPFLGIHFACCSVYSRIYINAQQDAYVGACPRCGKGVRIGIAPGGAEERFFTVY